MTQARSATVTLYLLTGAPLPTSLAGCFFESLEGSLSNLLCLVNASYPDYAFALYLLKCFDFEPLSDARCMAAPYHSGLQLEAWGIICNRDE